jgi:hypothetical protein
VTMPDDRVAHPIPVEIKNWAEPAKPPAVKNTTLRTYVLDPTGAAGPKNAQISDYEPRRMRMAIIVIDAAIALTLEPPVTSPDTSTASLAPQGGYLPPTATFTYANPPYELFGPDAAWINNLGTTTRVTVLKEYC